MSSVASGAMKRAFVGAVQDEWIMYSDRAEDFTVGDPIGFGASSVVHYAQFRPVGSPDEPVQCALKVIDLDILPPNSLPLLRRETQLMALSKHPNVLRVRGSWMDGHKLFIALRLMRSGSVADVMRYGWPAGFEEEVVRAILKQALEGLNYLHINGFIHRDVKAANLLVDDDGTVLLGDLGVAASLTEDDQPVPVGVKSTIYTETTAASSVMVPATRPKLRRKRKSFVGTPCWMAPEVISQKQYDSKADMWSFGITALELAQGRPPYSREPPHRALLKILQDPAPKLDQSASQHKYSKAFVEVVERCLEKDPAKRPTAEELLTSSFFKSAKKKSYLVDKILNGLPPLKDRQERRRIPSSGSRTSIGSWDFSHTVMSHHSKASSPTSTFHHHMRQNSLSVPDDGIFEIEDEGGSDDDRLPAILGLLEAKEARSIAQERQSTGENSPTSGSPKSRSPSPTMPSSPEAISTPLSTSASSVDHTVPHASSAVQPIDISKRAQSEALIPDSLSPVTPSPSGGTKLWRIISGKPPKDDGNGGPLPSRKGSFGSGSQRKPSFAGDSSATKSTFSKRVSDMFSSSS